MTIAWNLFLHIYQKMKKKKLQSMSRFYFPKENSFVVFIYRIQIESLARIDWEENVVCLQSVDGTNN